MLKHTEGEWKIVKDEQGNIRGVEVDTGWICDTQFESIESCEANANLIAAAPDLLQACFNAMGICDLSKDEDKYVFEQLKSAFDKAKGVVS